MAMVMAMVMAMIAKTLTSKHGRPVIRAAMPTARAARWPLGFAALVFAYWAFDYSLASNTRRANPEAAYRARPTDPGAVASAMTDRMVARNQFNASADDASNARAGLRQDPLNRVLLRTLGVHEEISGRTAGAFDAMQMAHRVSRRDSITELWLAEYHRRQGNPVKALVHYDAAMLVRPDLQKVLFPQMVPALASEAFRAAVRPYIVQGASWTPSFVGTAAGADLDQVMALIEPAVDRMAHRQFEPAFSTILYRLMARGDTQDAMTLAQQVITGFDVQEYQSFGWNQTTTNPQLGSLAWSFGQSADINASLDDKSELIVSVSPLSLTPFATRDVTVIPGLSYQLRHNIDYTQSEVRANMRWTAACADVPGATVFWQGDVPAARGLTRYTATIVAPATCKLLRMTAIAIGADSQISSEFSLSSMTFSKSAGKI